MLLLIFWIEMGQEHFNTMLMLVVCSDTPGPILPKSRPQLFQGPKIRACVGFHRKEKSQRVLDDQKMILSDVSKEKQIFEKKFTVLRTGGRSRW
jgi:hypothetical protein